MIWLAEWSRSMIGVEICVCGPHECCGRWSVGFVFGGEAWSECLNGAGALVGGCDVC